MADKTQVHEHADMANPEHRKAHGLKLEGRKLVIDDGSGVEIGELSDDEAKRAGVK